LEEAELFHADGRIVRQ